MTKKSIFLYAPIFLAIILPTPGRFVFGFTLFLEMLFLTLVGTLINSLINKLDFQKMRSSIILITVVAATIFFRQLFVIICPEVALTLGFIMYLPPISLFLVGVLFKDTDKPVKTRLINNMILVGIFATLGLLFFLFRDLIGYGTFTFYGSNHQIFEKVIITSDNMAIFSFFASIPGALLLSGIFLYLVILIRKKIHIFRNAEIDK